MPHVERSPHAQVPTPIGAVAVSQPGKVTVISLIRGPYAAEVPVTLTFDNGPAPGTTERVLDVLGERDLKATFFVVGSMLHRPGARELADRAVAEGHWVGNHSMTHATPLGHEPDPA